MIYSVDFKELAEKISHIDMKKYLHDLGWVEIQTKRKWVEVFQLEDKDNFFQIDLPVSRDLRDYRDAMYRCVECIAQSTKKSIEQVILELLNPLPEAVVRISHDYYKPINTVARKIKSSQLSETAYFGRIKGLDAPPDPTNRKSGKITLVFIDEYDKKATATVILSIEDYNAAIEAHREGKMVKIVGTLSGQMHKKIECTYFEVLE